MATQNRAGSSQGILQDSGTRTETELTQHNTAHSVANVVIGRVPDASQPSVDGAEKRFQQSGPCVSQAARTATQAEGRVHKRTWKNSVMTEDKRGKICCWQDEEKPLNLHRSLDFFLRANRKLLKILSREGT